MNLSETITFHELIERYKADANALGALSEFAFLIPLAQKVKAKGCFCGLQTEMAQLQTKFNEVAKNFSNEAAQNWKDSLSRERLCFGIQTQYDFQVVCH